MSISGDKTGIAGVWIKGKKPTKEGQAPSKELYFQLAFSVAIKAPKGHQISFEKNREFIRWLRSAGFNIAGVSSDTFQSAQIQQQLKAEQFNCSIISVDRVDTESRVCLPYQYLKSTIYEHRIIIYDSNLLTEEWVGLVRDNNGRVDHDPSGINSKDTSDAVCGALFNASKNAEQFAFDFGEDLDEIVSHNTTDERQQVTIQLEDEMKNLLDPVQKAKKEPEKSPFKDFGFGAAQQTGFNPYISQGIMYWGD